MGDKGKGRGQKGAPHGPRQIGPCWVCGGPHLQRDCPDAKGKGKGNLIPVPAAWNSWRPTTFTAPSPQQWRQWMPKGEGKYQKRKGRGKGKINELAQWAYGQLLGQIQYGDWGLGPYAGPISAVNLVGHAENVTTRKRISSTKESDGFTKVSKGSRPQAPKATTLGDIFLSQDIFSKLRTRPTRRIQSSQSRHLLQRP